MYAFLKLIRYKNLILLALLQLIVALTFSRNNYFLTASLIFVTLLVTASGYIINNYFDVETDYINEKQDRVVEFVISKNKTLLLYIFFTSFAIIAALFIHRNLMFIVIAIVLLLFLYSSVLKKWVIIGNVLVALLSAVSMIFVLYPSIEKTPILCFYLTSVFYISWIREVTKDIEDIEGDRSVGAITFPILFGLDRSKILLYCLLITFQSHLYFYIQNYSLLIIYFILILLLNMYLILRINRAQKKADFKSLSDFIKAYFIIGICLIAIDLFF
jgi:4-hydroxybenzoate polyprenyltransferase